MDQIMLASRATVGRRLSDSDISVLAEVASGAPTEEAARNLGLSTRTLRRRLKDICGKVGVATTIEAVVWAVRNEVL